MEDFKSFSALLECVETNTKSTSYLKDLGAKVKKLETKNTQFIKEVHDCKSEFD
jgi:hypothetical protein